MMRLTAAAGLGAAAGPFVVGCRRTAPPRPRLVLLLATCTLNRWYLQPYDPAVGFTPRIADFAREGAVLDRLWTEAGQSGVAFASIVTGTQADRHGVFDHPTAIQGDVPTLTGAFAAAGWDVYHFDGHAMAAADLGFAPGVPPAHHRIAPLTAEDPLLGELLDGLARHRDRRALVQASFTATHMRYTINPRFFDDADRSPDTLPDEFTRLGLDRREFLRHRELFLAAPTFDLVTRFREVADGWGMDDAERRRFLAAGDYLYRCAVHRFDALFGGVLDRIEAAGLAGETLVVLTADHGETLSRPGSRFVFSHGYQLAPEVIGVPAVVRGPGVASGRIPQVTRTTDLLPTLAGLAGLPPPVPAPDGVDLSAALRGVAPAPRRPAFAHTALVQPAIIASPAFEGSALQELFPRRDPELMWVARRDGDRVVKWVAEDPATGVFRPLAFRHDRDPYELEDVFDEARDGAALEELLEYKRRLVARAAGRLGDRGPLDEAETESRLRALGYLR